MGFLNFGILGFAIMIFSQSGFAIEGKIPVDLELVLAVDVSSSVSPEEYELQKNGIISALLNEDVQNTLRQCMSEGIGINYLEWSGGLRDVQATSVVPWTRIGTKTDMENFALRISKSKRAFYSMTDLISSLRVSAQLMSQSPFESNYKVISISGDGTNNNTVSWPGEPNVNSSPLKMAELLERTRRDIVDQQNIIINAIAIGSEDPVISDTSTTATIPSSPSDEVHLEDYFKANVIGGPGSFVLAVKDYNEYAVAIQRQILRTASARCMM